ncbi:MAG TPA: hypothetical protein VME17_13965 [Bryobacteraceae bacterium]|nr:hypothetical protein [Bryobacteraceae bacterium]
MPEQTLDFWPDLSGARSTVTPLSLMKQQAALLGTRTHNLLEGEVASTADQGRRLVHRFLIRAPTLNYTYEVFRVSHNVAALYPVFVESGPHSRLQTQQVHLDSEIEFMAWLKDVLGSDDTKRVLDSLLAQIES